MDGMKIIRCLLAFALAAVAARAADGFSSRLTPEELVKSGLGKLTPAERAALDGLVQKYGGPAEAAPAPMTSPASVLPAPVPPLPALLPAAAAPAIKPAPVVAEAPAKKGFLRRAKKDSAAAKPAAETIESEIDGSFTGWEETTVWTLKDGSIWRVDNRPRPYFTSRIANPKVKIYPALMNGFWLEIPELDVRVRVVRLR